MTGIDVIQLFDDENKSSIAYLSLFSIFSLFFNAACGQCSTVLLT